MILPFWWFLGEVEKSSFFDEALGRRKIDTNRSLERPGAENVDAVVLRRGRPGADGVPIRGKKGSRIED